jgi:4-amino-4-deoxy-L-arabinose transferase-like glycosyltransferase
MKPKNLFPIRIFCIALVLRLIPVLLTRSLGIGLDDMFQYDMLARSLASGNGFRWYALQDLKLLEPYIKFDLSSVDYDPQRGLETSFRAPLYPAFLAVVYYFVGVGSQRFFAARFAQAFISAFLAPLTYLVAGRLFPERQHAAKIAAWVTTCYPLLIVYPIGLATENLFFVLLLASFFFLLLAADHSTWQYFVLSGIFLGLTVLTRSVILPFAGLSVLWVWFYMKSKRGALILGLALVAVLAPWVVRNSILHRQITGIETSMGYNLYLGYHPEGDGSFLFGPSLDLIPILDDVARDRLGTQMALEFIRRQPGRFATLALNRIEFFFGLEKRVLMYFYSNDLIGYVPRIWLITISVILLAPFVLVAPSAILGLGLLRQNPGTSLLLLLLIMYTLPHILILSEDRFHLVLVPFLAILAARFWSGGRRELGELWKASWKGKWVVPLLVLCVFLLLANWGLELTRDADKITALLGPNGNQTYFPY